MQCWKTEQNPEFDISASWLYPCDLLTISFHNPLILRQIPLGCGIKIKVFTCTFISLILLPWMGYFTCLYSHFFLWTIFPPQYLNGIRFKHKNIWNFWLFVVWFQLPNSWFWCCSLSSVSPHLGLIAKFTFPHFRLWREEILMWTSR